jgi:hypothetical protein
MCLQARSAYTFPPRLRFDDPHPSTPNGHVIEIELPRRTRALNVMEDEPALSLKRIKPLCDIPFPEEPKIIIRTALQPPLVRAYTKQKGSQEYDQCDDQPYERGRSKAPGNNLQHAGAHQYREQPEGAKPLKLRLIVPDYPTPQVFARHPQQSKILW